jgi:hypothetical protein
MRRKPLANRDACRRFGYTSDVSHILNANEQGDPGSGQPLPLESSVGIVVVVQRQAKLFEVVGALDACRRLAHLLRAGGTGGSRTPRTTTYGNDTRRNTGDGCRAFLEDRLMAVNV